MRRYADVQVLNPELKNNIETPAIGWGFLIYIEDTI